MSWVVSGSSTDGGEFGSKTAYSASGSFFLSGGSGTYSEDGSTNWTFNYDRSGTLEGSSGIWQYSGSSTETGGEDWSIELHQRRDWNPYLHGATLNGEDTTDRTESYEWTYNVTREVDQSGKLWSITGGSGTETGEGDYTYAASASGSYNNAFDGGAGYVAGDASRQESDHWDYNFTGELSWDAGNYQWEYANSGAWNEKITSNSDYSGSGTYTGSIYGGTKTVTRIESGMSKSTNEASGTWQNNDYSWNRDITSESESKSKRTETGSD